MTENRGYMFDEDNLIALFKRCYAKGYEDAEIASYTKSIMLPDDLPQYAEGFAKAMIASIEMVAEKFGSKS